MWTIGLFVFAGIVGVSVYFVSQRTALTEQRSKATSANTCEVSITIPYPSTTVTPTPVVCIENVDVALVFDRSSTMTSNEADGRKKLEWAKDAAKAFVNQVKASGKTNIRISVSSFGAQGNDGTGTIKPNTNGTFDSKLHLGLSSNYASVLSAIDTVKYINEGT